MKNKNILEFCLSPDLGGLELFLVSCYESFKDKTNCKVIVAPGKKLDNYMQDIEKFYMNRSRMFLISNALKLAKYIDENDIDIIHFHWTKDISVVVLGRIFSSRKPKIVQSRHMRMTRFKDDFYHKFLYKNIAMMHAVTKKVKEQIEKYVPKDICPKVEAVYLGTKEKKIETKKVEKLKKQYSLTDEFVIGIVGRIEEVKGQHLVVEVVAKLKELNIKALVIGSVMDEKYFENLKQKVKELDIADKVIFTGFTKDVDEHMKLCDSIVLATENETFGLAVIEAMVNKVCIIATNKGGPLEIIDDNKDGLLFERNSDELAKKIELLYKNVELKEKIALAGYEKVKNDFNKDTQTEKIYELIKHL